MEQETRDVILAAGPSVVARAALLCAFWQQLRDFAHERGMRDLADVRALLDSPTAALTDAIGGAPDYIRGAMLGEPDAADQEIAWRDAFGAALTMHTRMQLRLGAATRPAARTTPCSSPCARQQPMSKRCGWPARRTPPRSTLAEGVEPKLLPTRTACS